VKPFQVFVCDNNIDQALRALKKKMQREGIFREMKRRRYYEKPSEQAVREKAEAVRRARKMARKQAVRDGLIAAPRNTRITTRCWKTGYCTNSHRATRVGNSWLIKSLDRRYRNTPAAISCRLAEIIDRLDDQASTGVGYRAMPHVHVTHGR
jgi:small subunit ribosomal protein S21